MPKTEVEKLLEGVKDDAVVFAPDNPVPAKDEDPEKVPEEIKNRQHKRLEKRLQAERETNIILNERLKAKEQIVQNVTRNVAVDERITRIFGNDTPEKIEMAKHFTELLNDYKGSAREEAIKELRSENDRIKREEADAIKNYESKIESGLEAIEDEYNVDLTSDASSKSRKEFLDFVGELAPKDDEGNPTALPDLIGAYKAFTKSSKTPQTTVRRNEIASRSMQQSGQTGIQKEQMSEEEKWLINNGIIKPRRKS